MKDFLASRAATPSGSYLSCVKNNQTYNIFICEIIPAYPFIDKYVYRKLYFDV